MEYYDTIPRTSVKKLMSLGLEVQLSQDRRILKVKVFDKELTKFKCDLIEEDYPKEFPDTFSILELNFDHPPKRKDSTLSSRTIVMIYNDIPSFDDLMQFAGHLEKEFNDWVSNK